MDSDSDLIVVDEETNDIEQGQPIQQENEPTNSIFHSSISRAPRIAAEEIITSSLSRVTITPPLRSSMDTSERTTRSSTTKSKPQPKLKFKLSEKAAAQAPGMSFLGPYDRELDSDDEDLAFEEQFILRMPPGEDCEKLRKMVAAREVTNDVWFKFKGDSHFQHRPRLLLSMSHRFSARNLSYRKFNVLGQAR
jgi:transcription initiation factor TFIID subunit 7